MFNRIALLLICFLVAASPVVAQVRVIRYLHPLLSPAITDRASGAQGKIHALVVGVSRYQQDGFAAQPYARRDAEAFAAFLKTPAGGGITDGDLTLLSDSAATLARVSLALNELVEDLREGDKIVVYGTLQGQVKSRSEVRLLLYDSPPAPTDAGFLSLSKVAAVLGEAAIRKGARILVVVEVMPSNSSPKVIPEWTGGEEYGGLYREKLNISPLDTANTLPEGRTFGNLLLNGLLGLADEDFDQKIYVPELIRYLRGKTPGPLACAWLAFSDKTDWVCKSSEFTREKLYLQGTPALTPILQLEVQPLDAFITAHADAATRRLYEDFILSIRLGHLLEPAGRSAAALLDSLMQVEALAPVRKTLERRLAVAFQDETQQALNAYLQTNAKELTRRRQDHYSYSLYPEYLKRAIDILGKNHFMRTLLEAKRLYFEGLVLRFEYEQLGDTVLLLKALEKQRQAIDLEPEAAFIYNEMGVICIGLKQADEAGVYFRRASELAPSWGIPHANLGLTLSRQGDKEKAIEEAVAAIGLNPWSPGMYVTLGEIYQSMSDLNAAESAYRRALRIDPDFPNAHYDLACLQTLNGHPGAALESLRLALKNGFNSQELLFSDPDLQELRKTAGFQALIAEYFPKRRE